VRLARPPKVAGIRVSLLLANLSVLSAPKRPF